MDKLLAAELERGSIALGLSLTESQRAQLLEYLVLLEKWNRAYNLTAVRDPALMLSKHLLDSLAIAGQLAGKRLIDVGTGAGLPGIPLAIVYPEREFHLLDSNGKKTRFLFQVKTTLGLDNIMVHQQRVESFDPVKPFDVVLSRAFASLLDMVSCCSHLLAEGGRFLAMKGNYPEQELISVAELCRVDSVEPIVVPGLSEQRHLVAMTLR